MDIRLPYSRTKRYLTGIDWSVHMLHSMMRRATGAGNHSQVVLTLDGRLDPARLETVLRTAAERLPVLFGRAARDWNLCPYWRLPRAGSGRTLALAVDDTPVAGFAEALSRLEGNVNAPFAGRHEHVRFHLIADREGQTHLGMAFDHRLLDALGAETFLELLARLHDGDREMLAAINLREPAHLTRWRQRFSSGRRVSRFLVALSRAGLRFLPDPPDLAARTVVFRVIRCDPDESARMIAAADREAGPFMFLPYVLARVIEALHPLFQRRGCGEGHYVVPVPIVQRRPDEVWRDLFFNHMSFAFFQVPVATAADPRDVMTLLRDQLYDQVQKGIPEHFHHAGMLARILPVRLLRQCARMPLQGRVGSFYFACLREAGFANATFMGLPVRSLVHTPRIPPPPGFGVCVNFFQDKASIVISCLEGILTDAELDGLAAELQLKLGAA